MATTTTFSILDNPVWYALVGPHAKFASGKGGARRYKGDISPFFAVDASDPGSFDDLRAVLDGDGEARVVLAAPPVERPGWKILFSKDVLQMVCRQPCSAVSRPDIKPLTKRDVPEILELIAATEPGPFAKRTLMLGDYFGIRDGGALAAMAGERFKLPGHTEVSAICSSPAFRGKGYARALTQHVTAAIVGRGETPFLHVFPNNAPAIKLYESIGFVIRTQLYYVAMAPV